MPRLLHSEVCYRGNEPNGLRLEFADPRNIELRTSQHRARPMNEIQLSAEIALTYLDTMCSVAHAAKSCSLMHYTRGDLND